MSKISQFSCYLIGFSFLGIIHTSITFGVLIGIAIILIAVENRNYIKNWFFGEHENILIGFLIIFTLSLFISSLNSTYFFRSLSVSLYLLIFILSSFLIYKFLTLKFENLELTLKSVSYSTIFCTIIIFVYDLIKLHIYFDNKGYNISEVIKFKGIVNLITLLVCLHPFWGKETKEKKIVSVILFILLIPILLISNSNSSVLGILGGIFFLILYLVSKLFKNKDLYVGVIILMSIIAFSSFSNFLPKDFDIHDINNTKFKIPTYIIEPHRQFIWGFVTEISKENSFFGIGPDTSNFIEGSQNNVGHWATGDMNFIPSHPHNFILELFLEIGIFGTLSFCFLILSVNYFFLKKSLYPVPLIFFNGYFWTSSLVNFSFWNAWWQGSYFLILAIIFSQTRYRFLK